MLDDIRTADAGTSALLHGMLCALSEVLGGLDQRLDGIERRLAALYGDADADQKADAEARRITQQLDAMSGHLDDRLVALSTGVDARMAALSTEIEDRLHALASGLDERLEVLSTGLDGRVHALSSGLGEQLHALSSGLESLAATTERSAADDRAERLDAGTAMASVAAALAERFEARTEEVREAVAAVEAALLRTIGEGINAFLRRQEDHDRALEALAEAIGGYHGRVVAVGDAVDGESGVRRLVEQLAESVSPAPVLAAVEEAAAGIRDELGTIAGSLGADQVAAAIQSSMLDATTALGAQIDPLLAAVGEGFFDAAARHGAVLEAIQQLADAADDRASSSNGSETLAVLAAAVDRAGAASGRVAELLLESRASLREEVDRLDGMVRGPLERMAAKAVAIEQVVETLDDRLGQLHVHMQGVGARLRAVDEMHGALEALRSDMAGLQERSADQWPDAQPADLAAVVRREAVVLTDHITTLSATVEALRATLQVHVDDAAGSFGRRASEAGRKLAQDLGLRTRR